MIFIDSMARAWWTAPKMNSRLASRRRSAEAALGARSPSAADNSPKDIDPRTKTRTTSWSEGLGAAATLLMRLPSRPMAPVTMEAPAEAAACLSKPPSEAATWTKSAHTPRSSVDDLMREMISSKVGLGRPLA